MTRPVLAATGGYDALRRDFRWRLPARLNMAAQVCDDWVERDPERLAIIDLTHGARRDVSYGDLQALSLRAEAALHAHGVGQGDRVGVLLSQSPWTAALANMSRSAFISESGILTYVLGTRYGYVLRSVVVVL